MSFENIIIVLRFALSAAPGIYYFSSAVWVSLLLSACINMRNDTLMVRRFRRRHGSDFLADDDGGGSRGGSAGGGKQMREAGASFASGGTHTSEFSEVLLAKNSSSDAATTSQGNGHRGGATRQRRACDTLFGHAGLPLCWNAAVLAMAGLGFGMLYVRVCVRATACVRLRA
jgi:hypothetical protein